MSEQPKASREITPTTGRKDRALEANGVAWNIMSEHQRETAFLRQCILYDDSGEGHKLQESITQLQRNERCVRRAVWLMALLAALAMAGLCYASVFMADNPLNPIQLTAQYGTNWKAKSMLYTIAVVLIILWLLGLVTSTTMGGFIHILLVIAIVVVLLRIISGKKPL